MKIEKRVVKMEPVMACDHCGKHPAKPCTFQLNEVPPELCNSCIARIEKLVRPIIPRPHTPKPAAAPKPKPKRGRPRKLRMRMTVSESLDAAARIKAENDAMLGR